MARRLLCLALAAAALHHYLKADAPSLPIKLMLAAVDELLDIH